MIDKSVSKKYAVGLFTSALEADKLQQVHDNLMETSRLFRDHPDFFRLLNCVTIPFGEKKAIIKKVFFQLDTIAINFLNLLFENNRGLFIHDIAREYYKLYLNAQNKAEIKLYSAYPIKEEDQQSLKDILSRKMKKEVLLSTKIDKEMIGGLIIYYKDLVLDNSIRNNLEELRGKMSSTRT